MYIAEQCTPSSRARPLAVLVALPKLLALDEQKHNNTNTLFLWRIDMESCRVISGTNHGYPRGCTGIQAMPDRSDQVRRSLEPMRIVWIRSIGIRIVDPAQFDVPTGQLARLPCSMSAKPIPSHWTGLAFSPPLPLPSPPPPPARKELENVFAAFLCEFDILGLHLIVADVDHTWWKSAKSDEFLSSVEFIMLFSAW